jgi:Cu/Ag efflux pump CusA
VPRKRTVLLVALAIVMFLLTAGGGYLAYRLVNRSRLDPVVIEVVAAFPGASAEEVERQVAIPLEVSFAGLPHLAVIRSRSLHERCDLRLTFDPRTDYQVARHEVINRLQFIAGLPAGVSPVLSPALPRHTVLRIALGNPRDALGRPVYTLHDLTALRDGVVERELLRVPRVAGVEGLGGADKRYEVRPDPDRLQRYGVTLAQIEKALASGNENAGGLLPSGATLNVRGVGLIGGGLDPMQPALAARDAEAAAAHLRAEEQRRLRELRQIVITTVHQVPVRIEDVVEGGPLRPGEVSVQGVRIGTREPAGQRSASADRVEGRVLRRHGEEASVVRELVRERIDELNATAGRLLPGVRIEIVNEGASEEDDFALAFEAEPGTSLVKVIGSDLDGLQWVADKVRKQAEAIDGIEDVRVVSVKDERRLSLVADRQKCARWGVAVADVLACLRAALGGAPCTQMVEGDRLVAVTVRWPDRLCRNAEALLDLPIAVEGGPPQRSLAPTGPIVPGAEQPIQHSPRLRLRDVVERPEKDGQVIRREVGAIYRENGVRLIAVRVRGTEAAVARAREAAALPAPYRIEWAGRR